jgi:hypothetical protein
MNGRLRSSSPGVGLRLRSIQQARREGRLVEGPERECTGTPLGERLGIAALYAGHGDADTARATALLVCAGISDTPDNRAAVLGAIDEIRNTVRLAVGISGGPR